MAEAARLRAVAVDLDRPAGERGRDEPRDHHAVLPALTRADGVEEACDHAVEPALLVVRECEELVERLRLRVGPAARGRRPVHAKSLLVQRLGLATVSVHLGRGGDEHALVESVAVVEHRLGALDVRHQGVHRLLDDETHSDRRSEVEDDVATMHELVDDRRLQDRVDDQVKVPALAQMRDVPLRPGRQVVEDEHFPAVLQQELCEVGADEARAAGDQSALGHGPFHSR